MKNFNFKNVLTIAKKELLTYFNSPAYYVVLVVFFAIWFIFFFKSAFLIGDASLRSLFDLLPWLSLVLVPALTMGLVSKEKEDGTLELLLTHPVRVLEFVIGKFLGVCAFILPSMVLTSITALSFSFFSTFDWGAYVVQVFGALLFLFSLAALGLFVSSLFNNQIASLLVTAALSLILVLMGSEFITSAIPLAAVSYVANLSLSQHLNSMARGVIEARDLYYFLSFIVTLLVLTYANISLAKSARRVLPKISNSLLFVSVLAIFITTNMMGNLLQGRMDFTANKAYTLSDSTKEILTDLDKELTINFYVSKQLPVQYSPLAKEISDLLKDYAYFSRGRVKVSEKDPNSAADLLTEAQNAGVNEVQFNVVGQEEFQVKKGYLGIAFKYGDKTDVIPAVADTSDLEYQLTTTILNLSLKDKKSVVFLSGHDEKSPFNDYGVLTNELSKTHNVDIATADTAKKTLVIKPETSLLVIAGTKKPVADYEVKSIDSYVQKGGSLLVLADSYEVQPSIGVSEKNPDNFASYLERYGVKVNQDAMYDVQFNETIRFGGAGGVNYLLPYPFWARAGITEEAFKLGFGKINYVTMPWISTLNSDQDKLNSAKYEKKTLLVSTKTAGVKSDSFILSPERTNFPTDGLMTRDVAYLLEAKDGSKSGKIAVVGDSDFLTDEFTQNSVGNLSFGLGLVSNLTNSRSLSDIKSKASGANKLQFVNVTQPDFVRFSNVVAYIAVPVLVGIGFYARRKYLRSKAFKA